MKHECIAVLRLVFVGNTFVFFTPLTFQISNLILVIKTLIFYPAPEANRALYHYALAVKSKTFNPYRFNELAQSISPMSVSQWLGLKSANICKL